MAEGPASTRALLVEDDPNIVDLIRSNLAVRGFDTVVSTDGRRALQLLETEDPDIVLLDLTLPEEDGFDLCRQIRERSSVAVIVVSARGGERDKVTALNMGADDYMTKPFSVEELLARITATLRRTRAVGGAEHGPPIVTVGDVVIDLARQQVTRKGEPVHLTLTEFALLRELVINCGKLLSHAHLLRRVWGPATRPRPSTCGSTCGDCGPSSRRDEGDPLIVTAPGRATGSWPSSAVRRSNCFVYDALGAMLTPHSRPPSLRFAFRFDHCDRRLRRTSVPARVVQGREGGEIHRALANAQAIYLLTRRVCGQCRYGRLWQLIVIELILELQCGAGGIVVSRCCAEHLGGVVHQRLLVRWRRSRLWPPRARARSRRSCPTPRARRATSSSTSRTSRRRCSPPELPASDIIIQNAQKQRQTFLTDARRISPMARRSSSLTPRTRARARRWRSTPRPMGPRSSTTTA